MILFAKIIAYLGAEVFRLRKMVDYHITFQHDTVDAFTSPHELGRVAMDMTRLMGTH